MVQSSAITVNVTRAGILLTVLLHVLLDISWRGACAETEMVEVLHPSYDSQLHADQPLVISFRIEPQSDQWVSDSAADNKHVSVHLNGQRIHVVALDNCIRHRGDSCSFTVDHGTVDEGNHVATLFLEAFAGLDEWGEEEWDIFGETSVSFSVTTQVLPKPDMDLWRGDEKNPDARTSAPRIVFENMSSSYIDPNEVTVQFRVIDWVMPNQGFVSVVVSGVVVAARLVDSNPTIRMPSLPPQEHQVTVILTDPQGINTGVSESRSFHVWPDHSWVKHTTATGDGLSSAFAGETSSFRIIARDRTGHIDATGKSWFFVQLVGPAIIVPSIRYEENGEFVVSYLTGEEGRYTLNVQLHYDNNSMLQDYGVPDSQDVIGWHIQGSPFTVIVGKRNDGRLLLNPYSDVPKCATLDDNTSFGNVSRFSGRWVGKEYCEHHSLGCANIAEDDDGFVWLPWACSLSKFTQTDIVRCSSDGGGFNILLAGSSLQRTLFFDIGKTLGTKQVQPKKYWTDLEATDTAPNLFFHWMVPGYNEEGGLDYETLLENLDEWVRKHAKDANDVLVIQASVHDIHLGSLEEYEGHIILLAQYLSKTGLRVFFRSGDALHIPPASRYIIERGLRDPRIQAVNTIARRVMREYRIPFIDTHVSTIGRPDKCIDGYHYFDRDTQIVDLLSEEICIGNSVARTQAQIVLSYVCTPGGKSAVSHKGANTPLEL